MQSSVEITEMKFLRVQQRHLDLKFEMSMNQLRQTALNKALAWGVELSRGWIAPCRIRCSDDWLEKLDTGKYAH
jgi:hypothetical protein